MRILSGQWKGRAIDYPALPTVRPTRDFVKAQIFNILDHRYHTDWANTRVLDYCAGSGQMGLEALSRGSQDVTFVDTNPVCLQKIQGNLEKLGVSKNRYELRPRANDMAYDITFFDPPYHDLSLYQSILSTLSSELVVVEMAKKYDLPAGISYMCDFEKKSGSSKILFLFPSKRLL